MNEERDGGDSLKGPRKIGELMPLISAQEALKIIMDVEVGPGPAQPMWLWDAAGHVLAEDVTAERDIPPFNRAAMDGYAVRTGDLKKLPCSLEVKAVREAGDSTSVSLNGGQCIKIMTGAAVPDDADAVVMIEDTRSDDPARHVTVLKGIQPWENIARKGEDAAKGSVILERGQLLTGAALSIAAGVGRAMLSVYPQPVVNLLQTGAELVEPGDPVSGNRIYNTNATLLAGLIREIGLGRSCYLGISHDNREQLAAAVRRGLTGDLMLLTGGVSQGDFDYVPEVLADCGVKIHFSGVAIRPGKPLLFGRSEEGCLVFGLPGNPVAAMVCFHEFVAPLLRRRAGVVGEVMPANLSATVTGAVRKKPGRLFYCCARVSHREGRFYADPIVGHGSGDYVATARVNGVVLVPADSTGIEAGAEVTAHLWQMPLQGREEI